MKTTSISQREGPVGPLASIDKLMARCRWSVTHYGANLGSLALDAMQGLLDQLRTLLGSNEAEAAAIDHQAAALVAERKQAAADGRIDAREAKLLARHEAEFLKLTGAHRDHAAELVG